jgi:hypothetical protein
MLNTRLLAAWPNYFIIPAMLVAWIVVGVLAAELLGAEPWTKEPTAS